MNADERRFKTNDLSALIGVHPPLISVWSRRLNRLRWLVCLNDTPPLNFGLLETDQKANGPAGGSQVIEALRTVFVREPLDTFQVDKQRVFGENIGKVFSDVLALVPSRHRSLSGSADATNGKFSEQCALVDLLEEPGAQGIGDRKDGAQDAFRERVEVSAFIVAHRRLLRRCRDGVKHSHISISRRSTPMSHRWSYRPPVRVCRRFHTPSGCQRLGR